MHVQDDLTAVKRDARADRRYTTLILHRFLNESEQMAPPALDMSVLTVRQTGPRAVSHFHTGAH